MSTNNAPPCVFEEEDIRILPDIDIVDIKNKFLDVPYANESKYQKFDLYDR